MTATTVRPYRLIRPCKRCPFRTDVEPYLRPERVAEIATSVQGGSEFYCHETTVEDPEDDSVLGAGPESAVCAGSLILMEKAGTPNQMARVAERVGVYDPSRLDMTSPVPDSWPEWQRRFTPEGEEPEPCNVVGPDCIAPAGYAIGGGIVEGTESAEYTCWECGMPVCSGCSEMANRSGNDEMVCIYCLGGEG